MTTIEFGGITFDDGAVSGFAIASWAGWWDRPAARLQLNDRPQANGSFGVSRVYVAARTVTVEGSWSGSDMASAYAALNQFNGVQSGGVPSPFRVSEPGGVKSITASVATALGPQTLFDPHFDFSFSVVAPDPLKYGEPVTVSTGVPVQGGGLVWPLGSTPGVYWDWGADGSSGRVTLPNGGTAESWPTVTASGGLGGGFVATAVNGSTVRSVRFERVIPDGSLVSIDFRTGRAWIDAPGNDVSGFLTVRDFFSVPAGGLTDIQFAPLGVVSGTPQFTATVSPAFL